MSWQQYVDTSLVGSGHVDKAAIFNAEGTSVWASSAGFQVTPEEMQTIAATFQKPDSAYSNGLVIAGEKFVGVKADERSLYGKKGQEGIVIVKTKQAILVAHHNKDMVSGNTVNTTEKLADYLISVGY